MKKTMRKGRGKRLWMAFTDLYHSRVVMKSNSSALCCKSGHNIAAFEDELNKSKYWTWFGPFCERSSTTGIYCFIAIVHELSITMKQLAQSQNSLNPKLAIKLKIGTVWFLANDLGSDWKSAYSITELNFMSFCVCGCQNMWVQKWQRRQQMLHNTALWCSTAPAPTGQISRYILHSTTQLVDKSFSGRLHGSITTLRWHPFLADQLRMARESDIHRAVANVG